MIYTEQSSLSTPDTNEPETLADMPATLTPQEVVVTRTMIIPGREAPLRTSSDKPLHWQQYITRLLQ